MNRLGLVWSCALLVACGGEAQQGAPGAPGGSGSGAGGAGGSSSGAGEAGATQPSRAGAANGGGGTGGGGGQAGAAEGGLGGQAGSSQDLALEPVVVIRGEPDAEYGDLIVRGRDLQQYEGSVVTVRIGSGERPASEWSERLGSGQARIQEGRFELYFPQVWEQALYKFKHVYIDSDADGRCTEGDPVYSDAAAVLLDNTLYIPTPFDSSLETCQPFEQPWPTE